VTADTDRPWPPPKRQYAKHDWREGAKFGHWTVIDPTFVGVRVKAQCVCGHVALVIRTSLSSGHSKSCGCRQDEDRKGKTYKIDHRNDGAIFIGAMFGRLTVNGEEIPGHDRKVPVTCACGTTKLVVSRFLLNGEIVSCGCFKTDGVKSLHQS
jgi:hypothetical protein